MKIGFEGFRGFNNKSGLIEIEDITILLGKNGSGKSVAFPKRNRLQIGKTYHKKSP